jgi:hypothetical protein
MKDAIPHQPNGKNDGNQPSSMSDKFQPSSDLFNDIANQIAVLIVRQHRRRKAQKGKKQV